MVSAPPAVDRVQRATAGPRGSVRSSPATPEVPMRPVLAVLGVLLLTGATPPDAVEAPGPRMFERMKAWPASGRAPTSGRRAGPVADRSG